MDESQKQRLAEILGLQKEKEPNDLQKLYERRKDEAIDFLSDLFPEIMDNDEFALPIINYLTFSPYTNEELEEDGGLLARAIEVFPLENLLTPEDTDAGALPFANFFHFDDHLTAKDLTYDAKLKMITIRLRTVIHALFYKRIDINKLRFQFNTKLRQLFQNLEQRVPESLRFTFKRRPYADDGVPLDSDLLINYSPQIVDLLDRGFSEDDQWKWKVRQYIVEHFSEDPSDFILKLLDITKLQEIVKNIEK